MRKGKFLGIAFLMTLLVCSGVLTVAGESATDVLNVSVREQIYHPGDIVEADVHVGEIDSAQKHTDGRHDDIGYQRLDDGPEGGTDDDTDGHVHHVTAHGEFLELLEHEIPFLQGRWNKCTFT